MQKEANFIDGNKIKFYPTPDRESRKLLVELCTLATKNCQEQGNLPEVLDFSRWLTDEEEIYLMDLLENLGYSVLVDGEEKNLPHLEVFNRSGFVLTGNDRYIEKHKKFVKACLGLFHIGYGVVFEDAQTLKLAFNEAVANDPYYPLQNVLIQRGLLTGEMKKLDSF